MRKLVGITALFAGLALLFSAGAMPAYADPGDPNGANGTVKIHDWPEHKNSAEMANDPKVCEFEIHGFKFDRGQTGRWWIQEHKWGNGDASKAILFGSYGPAEANGDWTSGPHKLADGHYKLFVEMTHKAGNSGKTVTTYKMKVFKVECPTSSTPGGSGSNTNGSNTNGSNTNGSNTNGSNSRTAPSAVAGFETAPAVPTVAAGASGAPQAGVAGSQSAPDAALAALGSLPATSTGAPALGLAGLAITGLGLALLRRQPK